MQHYRWEDELITDRKPRAPVRPFTPVDDPLRLIMKRAAPNARDQALSPLVPRWLEALPAQARPVYLCEHFARIVNRIAMCWPDADLTAHLFVDDYFGHKRSGRRGFPPQALAELRVLYVLVSRRLEAARAAQA